MSTLEVEFELTGLKFRITGERDDVSLALAKLQEQVSALAQSAGSAASVLDGGTRTQVPQLAPSLIDSPPKALASGGRSAKARRSGGGSRSSADAIEFRHDAEKFGFPSQDWNTATKSMWLLYILDVETEHHEVSAPVLAATFNKYFKQFGTILPHNVARDLGTAKGKNGYVNSDAAKNPETWYLLAAGKKSMEALIQNPNAFEVSNS